MGALAAAPDVFFRPAEIGDLDAVAELERAGYPTDEAASREALEFRLRNGALESPRRRARRPPSRRSRAHRPAAAPGQFLAAVRAGAGGADALVGYVCGTLAAGPPLTHASMSTHDPDGSLLCVHSVCVATPERRRGLATRLLRAYLPFAQATTPALAEVRLLCKPPLVPLYAAAGFGVVGPSAVAHGAEAWTEMALELK
jgi:hypothetical protein